MTMLGKSDDIPGQVEGRVGGAGGSPDSVGLSHPPVAGGALEPQAVGGADVQEGPGLGKSGIVPISALDRVTGQGAGVGGCAGELLHGQDTVRLIVLSRGGEMAVGVLVGDIFPIRGHKEALQGGKVVGVGELGAKQVEVIIGGIGLLGSQDELHGGGGGVESGANAIGIQEYMGGGAMKLLDMLRRGLVGSIEDYAVKLVSFKGEADDDVTGPPPTSGQG